MAIIDEFAVPVHAKEGSSVSETPRVRFAPSPTGLLHIGGARTAIYNWAFARNTGGAFILRIDDTDPERSTEENTQAILRAMEWLGLDWDEGPGKDGNAGPYFQSQRYHTYTEAVEKLAEAGHAYPCFCTQEELTAKREAARERGDSFQGYDRTCRNIPADERADRIEAGEPHVWRLAVPDDRGRIEFEDAIHGKATFDSKELDDLVILRSDGTPTYNFATVVDDALMGITHVIRGDDHYSNTPRQVLVYEALGYPVPMFAHPSMILGADGKRLSKRHGATSVEQFRDEGYLPEAMLNYLSLLGWSLDGETTIISAETLKRNFSLDRISKNPAIFDETKLEWMNGEYLAHMTVAEFVDRALLPALVDAGFVGEKNGDTPDRDWLEKLAPLIQPRVKLITEIPEKVAFLFVDDDLEYDEASVNKNLRKEGIPDILEAVIVTLSDLEVWEPAAMDEALEALVTELDVKKRALFQAIRVGICGSQVSPPLSESMELLGREQSLARLRHALELSRE